MIFPKNRRMGVTLMELFVVLSIVVFLTGSIYSVLRSVGAQWIQARNKLDVLMTTRIIMAIIRNDLRNAIDKPQAQVTDKKNALYIPLTDKKTGKEKVSIFIFDEETKRIYRGEKNEMTDPDPDISTLRKYMFDDGQILKFEFDSSYRDADAFAESELSVDSKVWFKVTMKVLYTGDFRTLNDAERQKIATDPNDPRVKTFFMMITPRRVNWLLQATQ